MPDKEIDKTNLFQVGVQEDGTIQIGHWTRTRMMTKAEALNLAAWLVALAGEGEFGNILTVARNA